MAHVTTPRWLSPVSRRIVVIVIAAAAAMMLLTSILVARASAEVAPITVRNIDGDACLYSGNQYDGFGVTGIERDVPRGDGITDYSEIIPLANDAEILLTSPPNRSYVRFVVTGDASVAGGFIFNRTDQKIGNLYDYRPGSVIDGILEPPPRDQGNEKKVTLCLGLSASVSMTATLNGVPVPVVAGDSNPVVTYPLTWVFTIENTGEVDIDGIIVDENDEVVVCKEGDLGIVGPEETATCTVEQDAPPGSPGDPEKETTFTVTGNAAGREVSDTIESIEFYVGLGCGDDTIAGGDGFTDNPLAGFFVGPLKEASECAVPVFIDTTNTLDEAEGEQTVFIGPPSGYDWTGVTGLLTVEWDVEDPADAGVRPTFQDTASGPVEIPICGGNVAVSINEPSGGDFFYTLNDNLAELNGTYPRATGDGEICLVLHTTKTIPFDPGGDEPPTVKTVTVEVFYIYDDPQLIRPR